MVRIKRNLTKSLAQNLIRDICFSKSLRHSYRADISTETNDADVQIYDIHS